MATDLLDSSATDKGSLLVRDYEGKPFYEAKWRDLERTQRKRRLGPAWLELDPATNEWTPRRGRVRRGFLDERRAYPLMASVIEEHEAKLRDAAPTRPEALFPEAVDAWLVYLKTEKRVKPSTFSGYKRLLARPGRSRDLRRGRIMREFGKRSLLDIKTKDARRFLAKLDRQDISARTVNIHRQVLHAIFEFARREETFGLPSNPFAVRRSGRKMERSRSRPLSPTRSLPSPRLLGAARTVAVVAMHIRTTRRKPSASGRGSMSRMRPSSRSPRAPVCASASWWRCAGVTSI